jgi:hypothetical protein
MNLLRRLTVMFVVLCWAGVDAPARTIVVAVDVSGSMGTYGAWQNDARSELKAILAGLPLDQNVNRWSISGSRASLRVYRVESGDQIVLLKFGDVSDQSEYPFFRGVEQPSDLAGLERDFPIDAGLFRESRTNKSLAESVAAKIAGKDGLVVIVSDFLVDARLSDRQIKFINDSASGMSESTHAILSWTQNPRVQIRFVQYAQNAEGGAGTDQSEQEISVGTLRLNAPKMAANGALQLSWNYEGAGSPRSYDVEVINIADQKQLFARHGLLSRSVVFEDPPAGTLAWSVSATLDDGRAVRGRSTYTIKGGLGLVGLLLGLLALGLVVAAIMFALTKPGVVSKILGNEKRKAANKL